MTMNEDLNAFKDKGDVIWSIANLLRGPYRPPQYRRVMIPLTVLRRLDCVLESSKDKIIAMHRKLKAEVKPDKTPKYDPETIEKIINQKFKLTFHNTSEFTFQKLLGDPDKKLDLDITAVALPMTSLIPDKVEKELRIIVGDSYSALGEVDRLALVLAHRFGEVSNTDIKQYRREHSRDIGERLKYLVDQGWLAKSGQGRGTRYQLAGATPAGNLFSPDSEHYETSFEHNRLSSEHYGQMKVLAAPIREKGRVNKELVRNTIMELCSVDFLTLRTLADLLGRTSDSLRNHYINPMIKAGILVLRYPNNPRHPQQGYKASKEKTE